VGSFARASGALQTSGVRTSGRRLEQWARLVVGGLERVYLFDGERLIELGTKPEYYQVSIKVFDGQFTDPRDKQKLVPTILGLWATVLRNQRVNNDTVDSCALNSVRTAYQHQRRGHEAAGAAVERDGALVGMVLRLCLSPLMISQMG
jgi:hypothetical protein